jgi:hypothetical protein
MPIALVCSSEAARPTTEYEISANIPGDCSVDVTQPILAWIGSVPNDSVLSFGSGACYRIGGTLELSGRTGLDFEGNGALPVRQLRRSALPDHERRRWDERHGEWH